MPELWGGDLGGVEPDVVVAMAADWVTPKDPVCRSLDEEAVRDSVRPGGERDPPDLCFGGGSFSFTIPP